MTTDPARSGQTDVPVHWLLRDAHDCVLGVTTISLNPTHREAWDRLVGDADTSRTPGLYLTKVSSREWRETYREKFGPCTGPSQPVAAVPAPVQGADPTGPQTDADGESRVLRPDFAEALAAEMAFDHYRAGRRREGKALDEYRARLAELRAGTEEAQS